MIDLHTIATEQRNTATTAIDTLSTQDLVALINHADKEVPLAVEKILPALATAVDETASRIRQGGRLFYVGAGTSGRLGILDAAECPPTYNTDPQTVQALIAGGESAVFTAKEGAEDSESAGARDLSSKELSPVDTVVGLSASGRTPYVLGALRYAASCGAYTIGITASPASPLAAVANLELCAVTGPEVITGSTRMKAGSAQKMILNILSTGVMIRLGKVYGNLMVDVKATNEKLRERAKHIVVDATGCTIKEAETALNAAAGKAKTAIVMLLLHVTAEQANARLEQADGYIRHTLDGGNHDL